ncbi:MAG TPA: hypothetical protein VHK27_15385, partial [Gammaproteobacteria bacterium]|nr:hypothetical protein [Gammaproteobacteria bacterium]
MWPGTLGVTADAETIHVHGRHRPDVLFELRVSESETCTSVNYTIEQGVIAGLTVEFKQPHACKAMDLGRQLNFTTHKIDVYDLYVRTRSRYRRR